MNRIEMIRSAAHCFRTDEKTIEKFLHDFFAAPDIYSALEVRDNFIEAHDVDYELLDDFLIHLSNRGVSDGT